MKNKIVVKVGLVFCVLGFLIMAFPRPSPASLVVTDLVFEGNFQFDRNGMYYVYGIGYPLNVLGHLMVLDGEEKLGDISLNGQKNYPGGEWDGTYFGHWAFEPVGCGCDYEIGVFPDLAQFQEQGQDMLGFTLTEFNEVSGIEEEFPRIVGSLDGDHFEGSPIPIGSTLLLLGSGLLGIVGLRRKRIG